MNHLDQWLSEHNGCWADVIPAVYNLSLHTAVILKLVYLLPLVSTLLFNAPSTSFHPSTI
ncbi:hypothetical protein FIBSPDRAFT_846974 [Athelia psychrophila]|uniref:Uncharacterized protein n=1 Tax=Athelia psychrophila TaxID=1759441 RepID=A0A166WJ43_9AGAM|nr:hypothetical protein FIBSPDRAFT_846974 [Fibularhizoctonia sp. CBS 109695]